MITCPKCAKDNQDHYKFCLGCGAELPRENAPKPFSPQTPPQGVPAVSAEAAAAALGGAAPDQAAPQPQAAPAGPTNPPPMVQPSASNPQAQPPVQQEAPQPAAAGANVSCPQCGQGNPPNNRFCASCGYNLAAMASAPPAQPAQPAPGAAPGGGTSVLLTALRADGSEAGQFPLPDGPTVTVGRDTGSIFAGDSYLSPKHASFARRNGKISVKDEASLNGVYVKLQPNQPWKLDFDDVFRIGQEIVRFEQLKPQGPSSDGVERFGSPARGYIGRLALVIGRDTTGNAFPIPERGVHLGRERGDILFSEDGYVSGLHCRVAPEQDGQVYLTDVGSSNGTFVRIGTEHELESGDILLMGQQLFRVDY